MGLHILHVSHILGSLFLIEQLLITQIHVAWEVQGPPK